MRYFARLTYKGTHYHGWQRQPNAITVQQRLDEAFSTLLNEPITTLGCGRTDTGVHASEFYVHFDTSREPMPNFVFRINKLLPPDIAVQRLHRVHDEAHARFDATARSYEYHLVGHKDPFRIETATFYPHLAQLDTDGLHAVAELLQQHTEFEPFSKTGSDVKTYRCRIDRAEWQLSEGHYTFYITADRFLRGMIRLIVGTSLLVARGKLTLSEVEYALTHQSPLPKAISAPPEGLFLSAVEYDYIEG